MFEIVNELALSACVRARNKNEHLAAMNLQTNMQYQYYVECVYITNKHVCYHLSLSGYVE